MKPVFYGVILDQEDPYLERNLHRLENRFQKRYLTSIKAHRKRLASGKPPHATTLQSIKDNKQRFEMVRLLEHVMLGCPLDFEINDQTCLK